MTVDTIIKKKPKGFIPGTVIIIMLYLVYASVAGADPDQTFFYPWPSHILAGCIMIQLFIRFRSQKGIISLVLCTAAWLLAGVSGASPPFLTTLSLALIFVAHLGDKIVRLGAPLLFSLGIALPVTDVVLRQFPSRFWPFERHHDYPHLLRHVSDTRLSVKETGDLFAMRCDTGYTELIKAEMTFDAYGFAQVCENTAPADLIVLGDSYAEPFIEEHFTRKLCSAGYKVHLLAIPGTGPGQQYQNLVTEISHIRHTQNALLLWCLFEGNDADDPWPPALEEPATQISLAASLLYRIQDYAAASELGYLIKNSFRKNEILLHEDCEKKEVGKVWNEGLYYLKPYRERAGRDSATISKLASTPLLKETAKKMSQLCSAHSLRPVVVLFPCKEQAYQWLIEKRDMPDSAQSASGFSRVLKSICSEAGLEYHDLRDHFRKHGDVLWRNSKKFLWWKEDSHLNPEGNAVAAEFIRDSILPAPY